MNSKIDEAYFKFKKVLVFGEHEMILEIGVSGFYLIHIIAASASSGRPQDKLQIKNQHKKCTPGNRA
jgi:hypothetical protein